QGSGFVAASEIRTAAQDHIRTLIDMNLSANISLRLIWDERLEKEFLRPMPRCLVGSLWLQFARAFIGQTEYRPCKRKGCPHLLTISTEVDFGVRKDRLFC